MGQIGDTRYWAIVDSVLFYQEKETSICRCWGVSRGCWKKGWQASELKRGPHRWQEREGQPFVFCGWGGRQRRSKEPGTWPHLPLDHVTSPAAALMATPWPLLSGGFTTPSCLLCLLHTSVDIGGHLNIFIWLWSQPSWNKEWWQREWEIVRLSRSCISVCLSSYTHIFKWTWDWETICFLRTCEESQLKKSISTTFQSVEKWVKWAETFMLSVPLHVVSSGGPEALVR